MDDEELRIELTKKERENWWADKAIIFRVGPDKAVTVQSHWESTDELYGDGCSIIIPARVWAIAAPWIAERTKL